MPHGRNQCLTAQTGLCHGIWNNASYAARGVLKLGIASIGRL